VLGSNFSDFWYKTDIRLPRDVHFVFLMQLGLQQAAPFVLSPIHLSITKLVFMHHTLHSKRGTYWDRWWHDDDDWLMVVTKVDWTVV